jgi:hypothetical protein
MRKDYWSLEQKASALLGLGFGSCLFSLVITREGKVESLPYFLCEIGAYLLIVVIGWVLWSRGPYKSPVIYVIPPIFLGALTTLILVEAGAMYGVSLSFTAIQKLAFEVSILFLSIEMLGIISGEIPRYFVMQAETIRELEARCASRANPIPFVDYCLSHSATISEQDMKECTRIIREKMEYDLRVNFGRGVMYE